MRSASPGMRRAPPRISDRSLESEALLVAGAIEVGLVGHERDIDPSTTIYAAVLAAEAAHRPDLVAQALVEYVAVMVEGGEYDRARTWAPRARAAVAAIGDPPELAGRIDMALALALGLEMRHEEALVAAQTALEHFERGGAASRRWLSVAVNLVGEMKFEQGHYLEARPYYERTLDIAVDALGTMHARVANGHGNLAETYFVLGDLAQAERHFRDSLAIRREVFGDASVWSIHSYAHVGDVLFERGRFEDALATYEQALALRLALQPARERPDTDGEGVPTLYRDLQTVGQEAWLRNGIAQCLIELGRADEALAHADRTTEVDLPPDRQHPDLVGRIDMRGQVLLALGEWDDARAHFELAVARLREGYPVGARYLAWALVGLGRAHVELGRHADAIAPLEEALVQLGATPQAHLRLQGQAQLALSRARWSLGRTEAARAAAHAAAAAFVAAPYRGSGELEAVQAWLAAHP